MNTNCVWCGERITKAGVKRDPAAESIYRLDDFGGSERLAHRDCARFRALPVYMGCTDAWGASTCKAQVRELAKAC